MALLCTGKSSLGHTFVAAACGENVIAGIENKPANTTSPPACNLIRVSGTDSPVSCLQFSPSGHYLAECSEDKSLRIWSTTDWQMKGTRVIPKRATALVFTRDDQYVLVADKTGEVCQYSLTDPTLPATQLLGHFSMLLDMVLSPCDSHVITCDRDEKLRVSKYPNSYNIENFCLGHKEFVSTLSLCDRYPHLLLSGSGDGTIRVWDWKGGRLLHTEVCPHSGDDEHPVVAQLVCSHGNHDSPMVVAIIDSLPFLVVYNLSTDGRLSSCPSGNVELATPPWSCSFDLSDRLWVCLHNEAEPLVCYKLIDNKLQKLSCEENPLCALLCKWDYFKDGVPRNRAFIDLKKHTFDNMSVYLARKEERIKEQKEKKAKNTPSKNNQRDANTKDTALISEDTVKPPNPTECQTDQEQVKVDEVMDDGTLGCSLVRNSVVNDVSLPPVKKLKTDSENTV